MPILLTHVGVVKMDEQEIWYRCELKHYSTCHLTEYGTEVYGSSSKIEYTEYHVKKHTPKGVRLEVCFGNDRFVLGTSVRQLAVPTKELALNDAVERKRKHVYFSKNRLSSAENDLSKLINAQDKSAHTSGAF